MPIRYIGRKSTYRGRTLFDILLRLRNFGVGRVVIRDTYVKRYPEPSYYVINRVVADMSDPDLRKGIVWCKQVFRGKKFEGEWKLTSGHKPDWHLLSKEEAVEYCSLDSSKSVPPNIVPDRVECPPLLRLMEETKMRDVGLEVSEPFMLDIDIQRGFHNNAIQESELRGTAA